jgi:cysteinyl-tRNA synthetase
MIDIQVYNSLSKRNETFVPLIPGKLSIYTCGPTVYDISHIGHARSMLVWDMVVRFFREAGYDVRWSRNITDIDDKIINRSLELGITPDRLARTETYGFWQDMHSLNITVPDHEPRASESLAEMYAFIQGLLDREYAYIVEGAGGVRDIYFRVGKLPKYGQLKNLCGDHICRIEHEAGKEAEVDFALWKGCTTDQYGYHSPYGYGRPGWHLECSAMIQKLYGATIDIHGGGEDLTFPHHENEIAQSEALNDGETFVRYWMHNGMILINGRKMSKSEKNYITIKGALETYTGNAIRFFTLSTHYRQSLNYTEEALQSAQNAINRIMKVVTNPVSEGMYTEHYQSFVQAMADDFNTARALAVAFELVKSIEEKPTSDAIYTLRHILTVLGFDLGERVNSQLNLAQFQPVFDYMLSLRADARARRDYASADAIRDALTQAGLQIRDTVGGAQIELD